MTENLGEPPAKEEFIGRETKNRKMNSVQVLGWLLNHASMGEMP